MNTYMSKTPEEYENDLRTVYTILDKDGKSNLSKRTFFIGIKQFMITHNKRLQDLEFWGDLMRRTRGAEPTSDETILNKKIIKQILSHGNTLSRALFLMLASSGRRIGEILALTPDDIDLNATPATINIKKTLERNQTKTGQRTICFISDEARDAYKEWMLERDDYLKVAVRRGVNRITGPKDPKDPRVFPMGYHNANLIWQNLLIRANLTKIEVIQDKWSKSPRKIIKRNTKWERMAAHPHSLRKFFRSYLGDADLAEYLMGHATMLTRAYRKMTPEDLAEKYRTLMPNVTIMSDAPDLKGINENLKKKERKIKEMEQLIESMQTRMQILEMKLDVEKLKNGNGKSD